MVVWPTVLILARSQSDLALGDRDFIWDGYAAMVLIAGAWQLVNNTYFISKTIY